MRFLLVDRILEMESGKRAVGIKNVTLSEDFLTYHFPEMPIMPGMLIAEALVQLSDWLVRETTDFQAMGIATAFERMRFRHLVRPGDQLRLEVEILSRTETEAAVKGKAFCEGTSVATVDFTLGLQPIDPYLTSDEARRLYRLILAPARRGNDGSSEHGQ